MIWESTPLLNLTWVTLYSFLLKKKAVPWTVVSSNTNNIISGIVQVPPTAHSNLYFVQLEDGRNVNIDTDELFEVTEDLLDNATMAASSPLWSYMIRSSNH
jgi:uncharacterized sporulation protein YeaH/YhbH (DUF444 family)